MKKILIIWLLIGFSFGINSQNNKDLYFITGNIYSNLPGNYNSYLYELKGNQLDTIKCFATDSNYLHFIKVYHELNKILILKDNWIYNDTMSLDIIDMKNIKKMSSVFFTDAYNYSPNNLVSINDNVYQIFSYNSQKYIGVNINNFEIKDRIEEYFLKYPIISGAVGGGLSIDTRDYQTLIYNKKQNKLLIPVITGQFNRPEFPLNLPDKYFNLLMEEDYISVKENDENYTVFWIKNTEYKNDRIIGWSEFLIYNKIEDNWHLKRVKGNNLYSITFNDWYTGWTVQRYNKNGSGFEWISTGFEERNSSNTTISGFDIRVLDLGIYMPGILYLYNLKTKKYIEWKTGQGDSEILLLQNETVYYRVNDKIYKRYIIRGERLSEKELLIQHIIVPDIHWAFFSRGK